MSLLDATAGLRWLVGLALQLVLLEVLCTVVLVLGSLAVTFALVEYNAWRFFAGVTAPVVPRPDVSYLFWRARGHGINPGTDRCLAEYARFVNGLSSRFGNYFVARGYMGERRLVVTSLGGIKHMFTGNSSNYVKVPALKKLFRDLVGSEGLLTSAGKRHATDRRILQPAFHHAALVDMNRIFHEHSYALIQKWTHMRDEADRRGDRSCPVDFKTDTTRATLHIVAAAAFSYTDHDAADRATVNAFVELAHPSKRVDTQVVPVLMVAIPRFVRYLLPFPFLFRRRRAIRTIREGTSRIVNQRLKNPNSTALDLLDRLLFAQADGKANLSKSALSDHCLTFLAAGHATTAISFVWAVLALSTRPRLLRRLRAEMREASPGGRDAQFDLMVLDQLPILDAFVKETLRFYPPFPAIARCAVADDVIEGHKVRAGTCVTIPMGAIMRNKDIYGDDADEFNIDRWIPAPGRTIPASTAFLPFAYGSRGCIGNRFASYEMKVLLQELFWGSVFPKLRAACEYNATGGVLTVELDDEVDLVRMDKI